MNKMKNNLAGGGKNWGVMMTLLVFSIAVKLLFSIVIKENTEDQESPYKFFYYMADLPILILSMLNFVFCRGYFKQDYYVRVLKIVILMLMLMVFGIVTSWFNEVELMTTVNEQLKIFLPFFLLISFNMYPMTASPGKRSTLLTLLIMFISLYAFVFLEPSRNRDNLYWPIYFSGLHTHAYVVFASFIFIHFYFFELRRMRNLSLMLAILFAFALGFGYGVRTSLTCLLTYMLVFYAFHKQWRVIKRSNLVLISICVVFVVLFFLADNIDLLSFDGFSSGRLSEYVSRLEYIKNRDWSGNLFGSGAGSDIMYSETWWWEDKGSHNDYLTLIIEFGFVYLVVFLWFVKKVISLFKGNFMAYGIFAAYLISSIISNGFMFRPLASYILFMSLVIIGVYRHTNEQNFRLVK